MKREVKQASVFEMNGMPALGAALPLAFQHVVAAIIGIVTPAIIVAATAGLSEADSIKLIQAALVVSALSTFVQLFPFIKTKGFGIGAGLPVIMGISFAYLPSMQAIAEGFDIPTILGAQIVGGCAAIIVGLFIKKIRKFFPPLIAGTVVFTIGLSLYPTAINYMAGGVGKPDYGSWQNWLVAIITLIIVTVLNHFGKGLWKLASILIGIVGGYIVALFFGMVDFSPVAQASVFQITAPLHFGVKFEISSSIAIGLLFVVNSVQAIGDFSATTSGGLDRMPTDNELQGGIVGYGITNIFGALLGGLPTATYSQNVGIVATTKVVNRCVLGLAAVILLIAGLIPKFSSLLTTIPYCVLGGATVSVFASIAMTGMKLITSEKMSYRNTSIVGLGVALGMGVTQASGSLASFPAWFTTIFGKSPVVIATLVAILLNIILPKDKETVPETALDENN
ncbi:uracil-xanthine permease family protein [Faecalicatena contorta]|uniref:Nucleobase:cation symporter-2, NCS2 family n=1 Tax=Faecalicatena contorta TaxID=39482 RepID=A0A315ZS93_9FIRM|nr:nucleobase:cation symporter-2 family protein [Faecalicatena contorta]PWJ47748.1 NCS2 family nucleobase:cation symporter-2 [Faecalicatena contorta]SUQ15742.1 nucleobase:cation symporter-2, NCS2 family [Faecalicatena contorta]